MMFDCMLLTLTLFNAAFANNELPESVRPHHRQRLPSNINAILNELEIGAIDSGSPTTVATSISPTPVDGDPTKSPASLSADSTSSPVAAIPTYFPTQDIFATRAPSPKPTTSPTITERPSGENDGLPTATESPTAAAPIAPPTAPFPTYKPTEGTGSPTMGTDTYPPTEEIIWPSPNPSVSWSPSLMPSETVSSAPSDLPSTVPSLSLSPTEVYRPSASPSMSSAPSLVPSSMPSLMPSNAPSDPYKGEPTHSIGGLSTYVSTFGCVSTSTGYKIFDGTTSEYVCDRDFSISRTEDADRGFIIQPFLTNPSIVEKIRVYADNNCTECDPVQYLLEGSIYNSWGDEYEWQEISEGDLPWINEDPIRNEKFASISNSTYEHGDEALSFTEIVFNNSEAYHHYRLTFPKTRDEDFDLVVAEVELPGREFEKIPTNAPTTEFPKPTRKPRPPRTKRPSQSLTTKPTRKPRPPRTKKPSLSLTTKPTRKPRSRRTRKPTHKSRPPRTKKPSPGTRPSSTPRPHKERTRNPVSGRRTKKPTPRPDRRRRTPKPDSRLVSIDTGHRYKWNGSFVEVSDSNRL